LGPWCEEFYGNEDWDYTTRFLCLEPAPVIRQMLCSLMIYRQHDVGRLSNRVYDENGLRVKLAITEASLGRWQPDLEYAAEVQQRLFNHYLSLARESAVMRAADVFLQAVDGLLRSTPPTAAWKHRVLAASLRLGRLMLPNGGMIRVARALRGVWSCLPVARIQAGSHI